MGRATVYEKATVLRDVVFGANDGLITTYAIIAGSTGANLSSQIILILGFANLFADGFSMASGNYLGIKSQNEYQSRSNKKYNHHSPFKHGLSTFVSFFITGLIPLIPFVVFDNFRQSFSVSSLLLFITLFLIGSMKSLLSKQNLIKGGIEMLIISGLAASVAYIVGYFVDSYII